MIDAKKLLDQFLGTNLPTGSTVGQSVDQAKTYAQQNPMLAMGAAGGLAALLLGSKTGRKLGGSAVKLGGLALIGGLAYKAYQDYNASKGGAAPASTPAAPDGYLEAPSDTGFAPENAPQGANDFGLALLSAMIAAAKADGHIDADEQKRIFDKVGEAGLDAEAKAFVMDELTAPLDLDKILALPVNEEQAVEIYAASLLAIDPDGLAEKHYLKELGDGLNLDHDLRLHIERNINTLVAG